MSGFACSVERSVTGQPWRWRRAPDESLGMDALVDELLLARGVAREDLPRHRDPKIRDFLPDPRLSSGARRQRQG
jgi:single-stranded-DNA-specific exonuclease